MKLLRNEMRLRRVNPISSNARYFMIRTAEHFIICPANYFILRQQYFIKRSPLRAPNELRLTARELTFGHELHCVHELPCGA